MADHVLTLGGAAWLAARSTPRPKWPFCAWWTRNPKRPRRPLKRNDLGRTNSGVKAGQPTRRRTRRPPPL